MNPISGFAHPVFKTLRMTEDLAVLCWEQLFLENKLMSSQKVDVRSVAFVPRQNKKKERKGQSGQAEDDHQAKREFE